jgi:FtsP/CotA-like multicopper oxidase with cupredoxin domain
MMRRIFGRTTAASLALLALSLLPLQAFAQASSSTSSSSSSSPTPVAAVSNPCTRFAPGSVVHQPPALSSKNGVLNVQFSYQTTTDSVGRQLFCFMTPSGQENPTLHVKPGDTLNVTVTNNTPQVSDADGNVVTTETFDAPTCGDTTAEEQNPDTSALNTMTGGSMNIHYHGTNTTPACGGDNVVKTLINPGSTFSYSLDFPNNEPPGLYWYHPHVHGLAEAAVQGGAAGAIVVDGIQNVQPATSGLRHRIILIRDQQTAQGLTESAGNTPGGIPQVDLTVNNISINTTTDTTTGVTTYTPAVIHMQPDSQEFWRISNSGSNSILDLEVVFNGTPQTIQIVGIDGVPVNSQDGTQPGTPISVTHFRMPPASRYEILVNAPSSSDQPAQLITQLINTGPLGDEDPQRPLINMELATSSGEDESSSDTDDTIPESTGQASSSSYQMFGGIQGQTPAITRTIYFAEEQDGNAFYINAATCVTSAGAQCATQVTNGVPIDTVFDNNNPPSIITTQGTVEQWNIQNRAQENHEFHQHQIHFLVLSQNNFEANSTTNAPAIDGQFLDMVEVPFCNGPAPAVTAANPEGNNPPACVNADGVTPTIPYPEVDVLMDFQGMDIGSFVFHCHILGHEDLGMMAIEEVMPAATTE